MKKNYIFILLFAFQSLFSQIINFPDNNFKSFLLSASSGNQVAKDANGNWITIDTNNDGQIQESEALLVAGLFLQTPPIKNANYINFTSVEGIRSFVNLEEIEFFMAGITSLDVHGLTKLKKVTNSSGVLNSLNLQGLINLNYLDCTNNRLTSLDLQGLNNVKYLNYRGNPLPSLQILQPAKNSLETLIFTADGTTNFSDLEGFSNLQELNFNSQGKQTITFPVLNNLMTLTCYSSLDLVNLNMQGVLNLKNLSLSNTGIINLDLHELTFLENVECKYGKITNLKLSSSIVKLDCSNNLITSLTLQDSPNLKILDCNSNKLTTLNFQGMNNLDEINCRNNNLTSLELQNSFATSLACSYNLITSLTVQGNTKLSDLYANNNLLTSFSIQDNPKLGILYINNNRFSSLSFPSLPALKYLYCNDNQLTSLNLSGLDNLNNLNCNNNQLTSLNLTGLDNLTNLYCDNNLLTSLDLNAVKEIFSISCKNNRFISLDAHNALKLNYLYVSQNSNLTQLNVKNGLSNEISIFQCPQLKYICCDEIEVSNFQNLINIYNLQNQCALNTYCSFSPGGIYNTISGTARVDYDNNGCTTTDLPFSSIKYNITDGTNTGIILGNSNGEYTNYVNAGNYTITPTFENPDYFIASPSNRVFVFADNNNNTQIQDFCITANGIKNDLEIKIIPITNARPGFDSKYWIFYKNKGNTVLSGNFDFIFDSTKTDFISSDIIPNIINTGNLVWNFSDLKPFESKSINVTFKTKVPPTVNANDILKFTSNINPVSGEQTPEDNIFTLNQTVVGSLDPNDKICLEGEKISHQLIGKYVTYKIRFENVGTANAEQVVIKDIIDSSIFDASSIIPITASHSFKTKMTGNVIEFIFENIDLPFDDANNDGYIVFKIKTLPSLTIGSILKNKADIFFDYNLPITTNLATSQILTTNNVQLKAKIKLYPNPVKDRLNIITTEKLEYLEIYDQIGRILRKINSPNKSIDFSHYQKGNYIIKIKLSDGEYVEKIIKE